LARYSHSRMETFKQCPLKYRFRYVDGIEKEEEGIEAFTGKCVHQALEELLGLKIKTGSEPNYGKAEQLFLAAWDDKYHPSVIIRRRNMTVDDYRQRGLLCLRNYFEMEKLRDFGELLDLELSLSFRIGNAEMTGVVDRLHRNGDTYHIIDYKTSKRDMSRQDADTDNQLALYEIGVRQLFPDAREVLLHWYMLPHRNIVDSSRSPLELERLEQNVLALIETIESTRDFVPVETPLCGWCDYRRECEEEKAKRMQRYLPT